MTRAYFNYPNAKVRVHRDASCGHVQQAQKAGQRVVKISLQSLSAELAQFVARRHDFASTAAMNDMWLEISLDDPDFEFAVVEFVHRLIASRYSPFASAAVEIHC